MSMQYEYDFDVLLVVFMCVVVVAGVESEGELVNCVVHVVAEWLGGEVVVFLSNHGGFLGGEYG